MDTAKKLLHLSALLSVFALLMASPAWAAATLQAPATVTIGNQGSWDAPVTSSDQAVQIDYNVTVAYPSVNPSGSWLVAPATGSTANGYLHLGLRNNSFAGIFNGSTATVTLTPTSPSGLAARTITVTFDGTSGGGSSGGTISASLEIIPVSAPANGTGTGNVLILTNSTGAITINAVATVNSGSVNWLSVTPATSDVSAGSPRSLTINANAAGLTAGFSYVGTITVTTPGSAPVTITVNLTVSGSSTSNGWTVNPGTIGWNYTLASAVYPSPQSITVTTTSGSATYSVASNVTWLLFNTSGGADSTGLSNVPIGNSFNVKLGSQANNLAVGTQTGTITILNSTGATAITITVTLIVTGSGGADLAVTPTSVSFLAPLSGQQQTKTVNVSSAVGGTLSVTGTPPTGLSIQLPANTTISPGGSVNFTVTANPTALAAGTYSGSVTVVVGALSTPLTMTLIVGGGGTGTTAVAPTALKFDYQLNSPTYLTPYRKIVITGKAGAWSSTISASAQSWLRIEPANGTSLPNPAVASEAPVVKVDPTGLTAGTYGGTLKITTPDGTQDIIVTLNVGGPPVIVPSPGTLIFTAKSSDPNPGAQGAEFSPSNGSLNPLAITATSNNPWITATHGDRDVVVKVDQTGLTTGVYSGSVAVLQDGADNSPTLLPVILVVNGGGSGGSGGGGGSPTVTVAPTSVAFSALSGSNPLSTQTLSVTSSSGTAPVPFSVGVTAGANWLATNVSSGTTPLTNLTLTVTSAALPVGSYTGNVRITPTGGTAVNIPVYLTVANGAAIVTATPATLTFDYRAGDTAPASKPVAVSGGGATLNFTATASDPWLIAAPATGTTPGTVNVSVNPTGLATGIYNGTVTVAGASGATGSTTVNVTLNVTAPLPTITKVTNAGSYATGSIAPGEIISIFANDPTHPIGPATAVGLTLDSAGKVATTLGGVQVLINGFACPLTYVSAAQVNAVVPYELKQYANANILVKFLGQSSNGIAVGVATTAPGLFTVNSSGTGPGAILNSDNSYNLPASPATRGDVVVVYMTGEGETAPAGVTGKVTTVASPPQPLTPAPLLPVSVTIGGQPADWSFAGEAPGFVSGVMQLNVTVPTNIAPGEQPIIVRIGPNASQQGVTVSVK